ncbi:hypothetical protein GXB85_05395 [Cellulomonas sp. APG4]|uniref:hypothetical protein n=1 Tax=Cellulomonas sp. APG4 TaxID=1538656 RepID=UPI00137B2816|nr:hypothetical protein [Cellulomonas sp. APG4]NCT90386.1 hypothetical protein [Cellulomonas sp. APG4]
MADGSGEQDEEPREPEGSAARPDHATSTSSSGISASKLYRLRREAAEARRIVESTEHPDPEVIEEAYEASEEAREALRGTDIAEEYLRQNPDRQSVVSLDLLGISDLIEQMQRSIVPDIAGWQQSILGNVNPVLPAIESMQAVLGSAAFDTVRAVQLSGVTSLIETMQAQQTLMFKQIMPTFSVLDTLAPALQQLSGIAEVQRSIIASSAIQEMVSRPLVDLSAILSVLPTQQMLADILTTADYTKALDLSNVLPKAFGLADISTAAHAATVAQQAAADVDDDEAEEAAVQAVLEAIGNELDPQAPPTPEQAVALETVARLIIRLRPNLGDYFTARGWLVGIATNGTLVAFIYLALAQPALLTALFTAATITAGTKWVYNKSSGLLLPSDTDED